VISTRGLVLKTLSRSWESWESDSVRESSIL
jgi:hypothetical protein